MYFESPTVQRTALPTTDGNETRLHRGMFYSDLSETMLTLTILKFIYNMTHPLCSTE